MTASHPQYFIVIDSISPHSNSQLLTAIHCDEPNTGFEPRLISAHFFCPLVWLAVTEKTLKMRDFFGFIKQKQPAVERFPSRLFAFLKQQKNDRVK